MLVNGAISEGQIIMPSGLGEIFNKTTYNFICIIPNMITKKTAVCNTRPASVGRPSIATVTTLPSIAWTIVYNRGDDITRNTMAEYAEYFTLSTSFGWRELVGIMFYY